MAPKRKRELQLAKPREAKREKTAESSTLNLVSSVEPLDAIPVLNELDLNETVPDPNETIVALSATQDQCEEDEQSFDEHAATKSVTEEWVESLDRDTLQSISVLLWHLLHCELHYPIMNVASLIWLILNRGERTIRDWRSKFIDNKGTFPESLQGRYQCQGVLWQNDHTIH